MIPGNETNKVYFSEMLKTDARFANNCTNLIQLLDKYAVNYEFLKGTNDIWCRDYMPIQINKGNYIQFRYEPSYLKDDLHLQSNPSAICKTNGFSPCFSKINLDGGNVVNWFDGAIITDRIFDENPVQFKWFVISIKFITAARKLIPNAAQNYTAAVRCNPPYKITKIDYSTNKPILILNYLLLWLTKF